MLLLGIHQELTYLLYEDIFTATITKGKHYFDIHDDDDDEEDGDHDDEVEQFDLDKIPQLTDIKSNLAIVAQHSKCRREKSSICK